MKKLISSLAVIAGYALLASAAGDIQQHKWSMFQSPGQGVRVDDKANREEPQPAAHDVLGFIRKYYHLRLKQSLRSLNDCNAEKAFLLHNAIWQVDSGKVVNLDCSGQLQLQAR